MLVFALISKSAHSRSMVINTDSLFPNCLSLDPLHLFLLVSRLFVPCLWFACWLRFHSSPLLAPQLNIKKHQETPTIKNHMGFSYGDRYDFWVWRTCEPATGIIETALWGFWSLSRCVVWKTKRIRRRIDGMAVSRENKIDAIVDRLVQRSHYNTNTEAGQEDLSNDVKRMEVLEAIRSSNDSLIPTLLQNSK